MKNKAIRSVKEAFEGNNIIIKILQGYNGVVLVDAKSRNWKPDMENFFSKWCTEKYADRLAMENYGKKVRDFRVYSY